MKYISLTGHISHLNHAVNRYLTRYDIQLERTALHPEMQPFTTRNPYAVTLQKAERFLQLFNAVPQVYMPMSAAEAINRVEDAHRLLEAHTQEMHENEGKLAEAEENIQCLMPFASLEMDVSVLRNSVYLHGCTGRLSHAHYKQYEAFLRSDEKIIFIETQRDEAYVWGAYFTPKVHAQQVNAVFASLEFVPIALAGQGTPRDLIKFWQHERAQLLLAINTQSQDLLKEGGIARLCIACEKVRGLYARFDVKKYASLSKGRRIFTFAGWMGANDADALAEEIEDDSLILFTRNADGSDTIAAPTRLRNPPIIRTFEFFTRLYGLPTYGETDPTFILAVTYTMLFGLMFGDVGHGLCLAVVGAFIGRRYKKPLGWIIMIVGISAMGFGFLYGSIFGFEDILPALWRRPAADITGTLIFAVGLGVGLIAFSMGLHMYNALRQGRIGDFLFGANGAAGLVFYGTVVFGTVRILMQGRAFPLWLAALPFALLALKHPIMRWMQGRKLLDGGVGKFFFETFMEMFETLLTYATNTVSFVRVGAFAVSHAGMMHVVVQMAQGASVSGRIAVLVVGNLLVIGIEGLLVGIQVLRLDFYEIFSRFYHGGGRNFTSHRIKGA
ncbi:MAG: hypothetical protein FWC16_15120 [Defluviitaleaceae bacterium]|nr:hypothetical protein [Defluviitaleaceae bacterium]MCL2276245.1 hypothetical protein [Defluviitaleaceae bacterium]